MLPHRSAEEDRNERGAAITDRWRNRAGSAGHDLWSVVRRFCRTSGAGWNWQISHDEFHDGGAAQSGGSRGRAGTISGAEVRLRPARGRAWTLDWAGNALDC